MGKPWTPEQREKFIKTMKAINKAKRAGKVSPKSAKGGPVRRRDVELLLRHVREEIMKDLRSGKKKYPSRQDVLVLLALSELEG